MYEGLVKSLRWLRFMFPETHPAQDDADRISNNIHLYCTQAADAIEELSRENESLAKSVNEAAELLHKRRTPPKWTPVTDGLPDCEWGAEVGNIEWISCGMVFAGCFGRGGKYRDAYFRTWTDGTQGIDAKDADYWRPIQIPEPPKEE